MYEGEGFIALIRGGLSVLNKKLGIFLNLVYVCLEGEFIQSIVGQKACKLGQHLQLFVKQYPG